MNALKKFQMLEKILKKKKKSKAHETPGKKKGYYVFILYIQKIIITSYCKG